MLVNPIRVQSLRDEIGAEAFPDVLALFLEESAQVVARLRAMDDPVAMAADLHFLKGSALTMGLEDLADCCRRVEQGQSFDPAALADLFARSRAALARLEVAMA
ncbi:histidine kinase [Tabrizicola sp. TH137]|uniref:Hpt domain-containing protein n=1 Tax=Tabrizicola sp. TH137 TaxID=2067452 RepID=UPI000C7E1322|nr:Hpt domain-containing protein [Tabrizicola sp. TH137]PLL14563.1 histidine kinase [Tabrizicola sp. TH137]